MNRIFYIILAFLIGALIGSQITHHEIGKKERLYFEALSQCIYDEIDLGAEQRQTVYDENTYQR